MKTNSDRTILLAWMICLGCFATILAIALFSSPVNRCCSSTECAKQHHHDSPQPITIARLTDDQLQAWYRGLNEAYFDNKLSQNVEVKWGDLTVWKDIGLTRTRADGSILITIDRATNATNKAAEMTVMHETCHVAVPVETDTNKDAYGHGDKFENCMVHLAIKGALRGIW